jgi:glucose/arabinose dehydrogenase
MQRVQVVHPAGGPAVTIVGTGRAGFNGDGLAPTASQLDRPTGVAVDGAGNLFIADTANCRVRVLPADSTTLFGRAVSAGHLFTAAGTGVCGTAGQGGPAAGSQLWNPVAVAVDRAGDLLVADSGDQSVLLAAVGAGTYYGTAVGAGDIGVVLGGTGSYGPYVFDGLPATGPTAELNDPRGLAVGPTGALFVTDGFMHAVRVVPAVTGTLLSRAMTGGNLYTVAGALPVATAEGLGDGTSWVLTHMGTPVGVAVSPAGSVYYSDGSLDMLRVIEAG